MKIKSTLVTLAALHCYSISSYAQEKAQTLTGPYLGQTPPHMTAKVFAPGIVSTPDWGDAGNFSQDMNKLYITRWRTKDGKRERQYLVYKNINDQWQKEVLPAGQRNPYHAPDGKTVFIGKKYKEMTKDGWSELKSLGPDFEKYRIMSLSASAHGALIIDEVGTNGNGLLRYSRMVNGKYEAPKAFGKEINTGTWNAHPFIAPDESYIMWNGVRESGFGSSDLYISFRNNDGSWGEAINLGDKVNTAAEEGGPRMTPDGKFLFFERVITPTDKNKKPHSDTFWIDASFINDLRPKDSQPQAITIKYTQKPALLDGRCGGDEWDAATKLSLPAQVTLYFMHDYDYFYICAAGKKEDYAVIDLMIENNTTGAPHRFHLSAQMGETILKNDKWESAADKWDLRDYAGFWVPYAGLEDQQNRKNPRFQRGTHRQVQIARKKFPGNNWNMMVNVSGVRLNGENTAVSYPENGAQKIKTTWAPFTFSK